MPTFKLVTEEGTWLTDEGLNGFGWRAGDRIHRGPPQHVEREGTGVARPLSELDRPSRAGRPSPLWGPLL
jgi:hypothetical protein